uniref:Odorant-binding protein 38 n=1 Tax=Encarsia formosa TaxID=32400 RepID=A0A514TU06_ENCFO|nr:odorant-binding protein 38 [Encarsia formosa]
MNYSFLILSISLPGILCLISDDVLKTLYEYENECHRKSGASKDEIEYARKSHEIINTFATNLFSLCMLKQLNIIYYNNTVNRDTKTYSVLRGTQGSKFYETCTDKVEEVNLDAARKIMNCLLKNRELVMAPYSHEEYVSKHYASSVVALAMNLTNNNIK